MPEKTIELKGSVLSLTVLQLYSADIHQTKASLAAKIEQAPSFFVGIPIIIEPKIELNDPTYLALLVEYLHQLQMIPIGLRSQDAMVQAQAAYAGLAIFPEDTRRPTNATENAAPRAAIQENKPAQEAEPNYAPVVVDEVGLKTALIIERSIRSGQQIFAKDRDLIVLGSVNPGSEVIADGNITVFGKLQGKAIAGASGSIEAKIFVKEMDPELVCVAGIYQLADDIKGQYKNNGLVEIRLQDEQLIMRSV
ncbi:putative septum site-determining protein MinC [Thiosulfatimonas sediminis]|uniref:Probable septum site-determining protein MinC n=1 Tax=Thiosulfatimonas sediminis TaxID=2675054 RepID=A0A6F8PTB4_9GAMM|nr:septum site-determining protein MinC [Thiosulfatimonas sediminis]BBP45371.1 putative septum site-determining protein MinC [Thiosulfatimonas sediminis]